MHEAALIPYHARNCYGLYVKQFKVVVTNTFYLLFWIQDRLIKALNTSYQVIIYYQTVSYRKINTLKACCYGNQFLECSICSAISVAPAAANVVVF